MDKKEVSLLSEIEALECLLNRLPEEHSHRKFFEVELYRSKAGKLGEARMKKKFKEFYSEEEHHIIWNVNLAIGDWRVQMDGLLLTDRCALIIESKNISGKIHFDEATGEFYRFNEIEEKTVMEDPVIQLNKHMRFLEAWFKLQKINLPIDGLIVFTPKQCEFISKPKDKFICKTYQMVDYLHIILQNYPQSTASHRLMNVKSTIADNQVPYQRIPLCERYRLDPKELRAGVRCYKCKYYSMERKNKRWKCKKCGEKASYAHAYAVSEYFSLIGNTISNRQFREFCTIESQPVATRLITGLNLEESGERKGRKYRLRNELKSLKMVESQI